MRRRHFLRLIASLGVLGLLPALRAERDGRDDDEGGSGRGREGRSHREKGDSSLEDAMEEMSSAFRQLRRQVADPRQNASSATLAATMHRQAKIALDLKPRMVVHAPQEEQAALLSGYRKRIQELIATIEDLQQALKAGKNRDAESLVDDLRDLQKSGHRKYRTED